ncbi:MAG: hypothetical protein M1820_007672 [Bogoriella megaspora]|nr:MAG: hypothetical protein M1820_007672 [Bogoriella megaspora]
MMESHHYLPHGTCDPSGGDPPPENSSSGSNLASGSSSNDRTSDTGASSGRDRENNGASGGRHIGGPPGGPSSDGTLANVGDVVSDGSGSKSDNSAGGQAEGESSEASDTYDPGSAVIAALGNKGNEDPNEHDGSEAGAEMAAILVSGEGTRQFSDQGAGGSSYPDANDGNGRHTGANGADRLFEQALSGRIVSLGSSGVEIDRVLHPFLKAHIAGSVGKELEASFTISGIAYTVYEGPDRPGTALVIGPQGVATALASCDQNRNLDGWTTISRAGSLAKEAVFTDAQRHAHIVIQDLCGDGAMLDGSITLSEGNSTLFMAVGARVLMS